MYIRMQALCTVCICRYALSLSLLLVKGGLEGKDGAMIVTATHNKYEGINSPKRAYLGSDAHGTCVQCWRSVFGLFHRRMFLSRVTVMPICNMR